VWLSRTRQRELRPEGDQQHHRQALDALDRQPQQLLRGRIAPVHVLIGQQYRLCGGQALELIDQCFQRQLLLALRRHLERWVAAFCRQAEQRSDQRHRLIEAVGAARQQRLQLGQLHLGRLVALQAGGALELLDHRMEGAGRMMRRALVEQADVGLVG
jgi:hypothetical protein